ncbi:hypothetical protein O3G_MSEX011356 [Manduca sexta]|uniref:Dendritic cell-specific transmembrane protein-like domain-containing protein n=1 Tax=Manduca sexta TaxID=7130 RepID=A0A921ZKS4_MANSE|nr:hypothetical protein O3G_MSEX011356 [Manduca sexta]
MKMRKSIQLPWRILNYPKKTVLQKWRHYRFDTQKRISKTFRQLYPEGSSLSNFIIYLRTKQTFTNILVKAIFGFIGGYVLSYLCFIFFVYQLSISVVYATVLSFIIGILLTLGLAFSYRIRCLIFLLVPQFFSRFGRYTLTCYALILILTGPATNTLKNSEVLSESMACSQEQIKTSLNNLNESVKKPHNFLKDSVKQIMEKTKKISLELKQIMIKINRLILSVVSAIQMNFEWLKSIAVNCNKKLGTPHEFCTQVLKNSIAYCEEVFGAVSKLCDKTNLAREACADTKAFEAFCGVSEFVDDCFLATVRRRLKDFSDRIEAMMHVEVRTHHSYSFSADTSGSTSQVAAGIVTEIRNRADPLLTWLSWSSCVTSLFLLLIIFRAKYYQHMYETRSRFDNRYVSKELRDLDLKRLREGRETILPLNRREKAKYINITSFRLLTSERTYWSRSVVFMTITTFKLLIHMVADYSLYWVLMTIKYHGSLQTPLPAELPRPYFDVSDAGLVGRFLKSTLSILEIPLFNTDSSASCLPNPKPPDFRRYTQIGVLIFLLWFFALFEPYGLRLRHVIMSHYRPERARERAVWLYNHILRTRGKYIYDVYCNKLFFILLSMEYLLYIKLCECKDCPGTYCCSCFAEIGQLCTICLSPEDYGDLSDVSLERGSSGESSDSEDENDDNGHSRINTERKKYPGRRYNENNNITKYLKTTNQKNVAPRTKQLMINTKTTDDCIDVKHLTNTLCFENCKKNSKRVKRKKGDKKKSEKKHNRKCRETDNHNKLNTGTLYGHIKKLKSLKTICSTCWSNVKLQIAKCTSSGMLKINVPRKENPDNNQLKIRRKSKIDITKKALERFRNRISQKFQKGPSTKNVTRKLVKAAEVSRERIGRIILRQNNSSTTRRVNYFRSIVNNDVGSINDIFEETGRKFCIKTNQSLIDQENPATHCEGDGSYNDDCNLPAPCDSNTSRKTSEMDTLNSKKKKCVCDKSKNVPRLKTPLKLMRDLCASLFGSSTEEETSCIIRKENKANKGVNVLPKVKSLYLLPTYPSKSNSGPHHSSGMGSARNCASIC